MRYEGQHQNPFPRLGEILPPFKADSSMGSLNLADYLGRWVVLFSYPADFTPVCASEVVAFAKIEPELKKAGCELIGLSTDSVEAHLPWLQSIEDWMGESIRFPIIGDENGVIARQYGMIMPHISLQQAERCTFILDPEQVLRAMIFYPVQVGRNTEEIVRLVKALQATHIQHTATPANWLPGNPLLKLPSAAKVSVYHI